jgi:DNA-directed RNA polymerase subunit RPC12/RpoP
MPSRVFISTECTQCGGSLNLEEGTNAITCPYCSSSFLVTGYDKVLNYYIPKNLDERRTVARSLAYRHLHTLTDHYRIQEINLFHLPFYRLRGKIFQLETAPGINSPLPGSSNYKQTKVRSRYLEKSFLATRLERLKLYSLGVRTSVLKLSLLKKEKLEEKGKVYPVTMGVDKAIEIGLGVNYKDEPDHCVISRILSIVYSPLWEVNVLGIDTSFSIIIDALAESIIEKRAPYKLLTDNLKEGDSRALPTISFHTLQCPNCGWDLAAKPEQCVFLCDNCNRAWESGAEGFQEAGGAIAHVQSIDDFPSLKYYPFWILSAQGGYKLFIPAFKVRDLTVIYRLATAFTNVQPELNLTPLSDDVPSSQMEGAVMRWDDARELAELVLCSLFSHPHPGAIKQASLEITSRQLVWLPFYEKGIYLRDALLNVGIQKGKISSPKLKTG